jgi:hypothetical protein
VNEGHELWHSSGLLYAFFCPDSNKLLYLGKAEGKTVGERWHADDKQRIHFELRRAGYKKYNVLVGDLTIHGNSNATLALVESVLIFEHRPFANQKHRKTVNSDVNLDIRHHGDWPHFRQTLAPKGAWKRLPD